MFAVFNTAYLVGIATIGDLPISGGWVMPSVAFICATSTGFFTKSSRFIQFTLLGFLMAIVCGTSNFIWSELGYPADFPGVSGSFLIGMLFLPFLLVPSLAGGFLGSVIHDKVRT